MGGLAPWHWAIIIIVVFLVFGASLLPRLGRYLGGSLTGLKRGLKEGSEQFKSEIQGKTDGDEAKDESSKNVKGDS